jgi:hypothetical protein
MDPDRHCATINATSPVPADCCGYCFLRCTSPEQVWQSACICACACACAWLCQYGETCLSHVSATDNHSNIHLAKLFNCTGMQDILNNDEAIHVLAEVCVTLSSCPLASSLASSAPSLWRKIYS